MPNQKPLNDMVPELLAFIQKEEASRITFNNKLMQIYQGNLLKHIKESCQSEYSASTYIKIVERIPPINLLNKVIQKTSKVYEVEPVRTCNENEIDSKLLSFYQTALKLDSNLSNANELFTLHKCFALEPFAVNGKPQMRVHPADSFLVYSDDVVNPTEMTVFIKFMGTIKKVSPTLDKNGQVLKNAENTVRNVKLFYIYSSDEFMIVDNDGIIHEYRENPIGIIPFIYCNASPFELMPTPDSDNYSITVLIPKLLADLNFAVMYSSHSIVYAIDCEFPANVSRAPDDIWLLKSSVGANGEKTSPSLEVLKPQVDISEVLNLIQQTVSLWLDCKGIKSSASGSSSVDTAVSGVAKMIDESDASAVIKKQAVVFKNFEKELWNTIKKLHNYWVSNNMLLDVSKDFSNDFSVDVKFGEVKLIPSRKQTLEELKAEFELKLITVKQALERLNPGATKETIERLVQELENESSMDEDKRSDTISKIIKDDTNNEEE